MIYIYTIFVTYSKEQNMVPKSCAVD